MDALRCSQKKLLRNRGHFYRLSRQETLIGASYKFIPITKDMLTGQ
jgi:hypothetical protein